MKPRLREHPIAVILIAFIIIAIVIHTWLGGQFFERFGIDENKILLGATFFLSLTVIHNSVAIIRIKRKSLSGNVTVSEEHEKIFRDVLPLVKRTKHEIRMLLHSTGPKAPIWFHNELIKQIERNKSKGLSTLLQVVLIYNDPAEKERVISRVRERNENYYKKGLNPQIHIKQNPESLGVDFLILDSSHLSVAFAPESDFKRAVSVTVQNQPELVSIISRWYENRVVPGSELVLPSD